jgi:arsenate reductase
MGTSFLGSSHFYYPKDLSKHTFHIKTISHRIHDFFHLVLKKFPYSVKMESCKEGEPMRFICYPKCTTCKKARDYLDIKEIPYEERDIKTANPSYEELKRWFATSGLPIKRFFNTSGMLYKSLKLKDKLPTMSEEECLKLLATDGMLVKRPLLVGDDFVLVGFKPTEWEGKL